MEKNMSSRIHDLGDLDLNHDIPKADLGPISLNYASSYDSNFEDYDPFCSNLSLFLQESMLIKKMNDIVQEGMEVHVSLLYTWRSISRPLYSIQVPEEDRNELHQSQLKILLKPMNKLYALCEFIEKSLLDFVDVVDNSLKQKEVMKSVSEGILIALGKMISMLVVIDDLICAKSSVRNDFSFCRRLLAQLKNTLQDLEFFEKFSGLTIFQGQPMALISRLTSSLCRESQRFTIIYNILALHANILENQIFFDPHRRYQIVRIMLGCLTILSQQKGLGSQLDKHKISLGRLDKLFHETPVIPLVGDMLCQVSEMLKRTNIKFDFLLIDRHNLQKNEQSINIIEKMSELHIQYLGMLTELLQLTNSLSDLPSQSGSFNIDPISSTKVFKSAYNALRIVGKWSYMLHELFFYKMTNPLPRSQFSAHVEEVDNYSLATRYNYSPGEKSAVSRLVFMIKSIYIFLKKNENLITSAINTHIYTVYQNFLHTTVHPTYKKLQKSKLQELTKMMRILTNGCSDKVEVLDSKMAKKAGRKYDLLHRTIGPLSTQLYLTRTMLEMIMYMKDAKRAIDNTFLNQMQAFLHESSMFAEMMNFAKYLEECTRLDTLWFKDFYIELSAGKHIQYPISDSIPWIMMEHLLKIAEPNSCEFALYLTSIYDDAADCILHKLKVRHLYDEVVSEANLVFKQLCYILALRIYSACRSSAFDCLLNKNVKNVIVQKLVAVDPKYLSDISISFQPFQNLRNLCHQHSVQFLGGRINLNAMLSQRLHHSIKESLRNCISYFESQDIHSVIHFSYLIDIYRETHVNLSLDFDIPPFEVVLKEVNGNMPGYVPVITQLILRYLVNDLAPNYSFSIITERFIRSPKVFSGLPPTSPKSFQMNLIYPSKGVGQLLNDKNSLYSQFVGIEHFVEIFKLVGYSGLLSIVEEIKICITHLLRTSIKNYVQVLRKAMPIKFVLPPIAYGLNSVIEFFYTLFGSILKYEQMRSGVLHNFRILGNYFLIVYMLEKAANFQDASDMYFSYPMAGMFITDPCTSPSDQKMASTFDFIQPYVYEKFQSSSISENFKKTLDKSNAMCQEKFSVGLSAFVSLFEFVRENMEESFWKDINPELETESEGCGELHRILSVVFYYISMSHQDPESSVDYIFGDGVLCGGLFLIVSLGQEDVAEISDICCHTISASEMDSACHQPIQFTSGTLKHTMKKSPRINVSDDITEANKVVLESMKRVVAKRRIIQEFFLEKLSRCSKPRSIHVKTYQPPKFFPQK
ncbi:Cytoplasmic FMR1-interacting protein 2 [Thelohanellus kitauei]|uniref:Cytoplasmic FMR1-interacting protein n=1 Tax=Thelohanellus kitauei TaxID=669202 RepID=A0A0C2JMX9_THEKT|nr:Cytoplasmic FMR1-interacting protein 2 [Thelohanellus kitauei]